MSPLSQLPRPMKLGSKLIDFFAGASVGLAALGGYARRRPLHLLIAGAVLIGTAASWRAHPILGTAVSVAGGIAFVRYISNQ